MSANTQQPAAAQTATVLMDQTEYHNMRLLAWQKQEPVSAVQTIDGVEFTANIVFLALAGFFDEDGKEIVSETVVSLEC